MVYCTESRHARKVLSECIARSSAVAYDAASVAVNRSADWRAATSAYTDGTTRIVQVDRQPGTRAIVPGWQS